MRPIRTVALAAVLSFAASGCGGARRVPDAAPVAIDPPRFRAEAVLPQARDADGVTLAVTGRIENPNPFPLRVARLTYAFDVLGARVDAGAVASELALPAGAAVPVTVPARLRWVDVPGFLGVLVARESLPFTVRGAALVRAGRGMLEVPYAIDGSVVLPRLPGVVLHDAVVRESSLLHTIVDLRVDVTNPNPFPLPTGRLAYDLSISGVPVAQAARWSLETVPPNGRATIVVPVRFSTIGAAAGALSGAVRGRTDVVLVGRAGYGALEVGVDARGALLSR
jgi:LEA14-like dessication related protein